MALLNPAYICPPWEKRETRATARSVSRADEHSSSRSRPQGHVASEGRQARGAGLGIGGASVNSVETVHCREKTRTAIQEPRPDRVNCFKAQVLSRPPIRHSLNRIAASGLSLEPLIRNFWPEACIPRSAVWYDIHIGAREGSPCSWGEAHTSAAAAAAEQSFKH